MTGQPLDWVARLVSAIVLAGALSACGTAPDTAFDIETVEPTFRRRDPTDRAPRPADVAPGEENFTPVIVRLPTAVLSETFPVLVASDNVAYAPIGLFGDLLGITVDQSDDLRRASGFVVNPNQTFEIDATGAVPVVTARGLAVPSGAGDVVVLDNDDMYVSSDLLESLWPVTLSYDSGDLVYRVEPAGPLPILERQRFEDRRRTFRPRDIASTDQRDFPEIENPYGFGVPASAIGYNVRIADDEIFGSHNLSVGGDAGVASANLFASGDETDALQNIRARFTRDFVDEDGTDVRLDFGDVTFGSVQGAGGASGLGAVIGSQEDRERLDEITIEGEGPPGWDVEIRNVEGGFIAFGVVDSAGNWEFTQVPVRPRRNEFVILLISPAGEIIRQRESFFVGPAVLEPGVFLWRVGGGLDTTLNDELVREDTPGGRPAAVASFEYGFSETLTLTGGVRQSAIAGGSDTAFALGANTSILDAVLGQTIALDAQGNGQTSASLSRNFFDQALSLSTTHSYSDDGFGGAEDSTWNQSYTASVRAFGVSTNTTLRDRQVFVDGTDRTTSLSGSVFTSLFGAFLSVRAQREISEEDSPIPTTATVSFRPLEDVFTRLTVDRDLNADEFQSFGIDNRWRITDATSLSVDFAYNPVSEVRTYSADLGVQVGPVDVEMGVRAVDSTLTGRLGLRTSFGPRPQQGGIRFSAENLPGRGAVSVLFCVDANSDGTCQPDEERLEGISLTRLPGESGPDGILIAEVPVWVETVLSVNEGTIEDPFIAPAEAGYLITVRPGQTVPIEIPLIPFGDIVGIVQGPGDVPLGNVSFEIREPDGTVRFLVRTDRFGEFYVDRLPYGTYTIVSVDDRWRLPEPVTVTLTAEDAAQDVFLDMEPISEDDRPDPEAIREQVIARARAAVAPLGSAQDMVPIPLLLESPDTAVQVDALPARPLAPTAQDLPPLRVVVLQ